MEPKLVHLSPRPGMVVPFYDPDRMAGLDLKTRQPIADTPHIQFGRHLVQQGYVVVCTEAFPYNAVPAPENNVGFAWWEQATENCWLKTPTSPVFNLAHHQLLALCAPRPFFLIGGEADRPASWQYIIEAQKVYDLYGKKDAIGFLDHASGHRPTEESLVTAYQWLAEQFNLEPQSWKL